MNEPAKRDPEVWLLPTGQVAIRDGEDSWWVIEAEGRDHGIFELPDGAIRLTRDSRTQGKYSYRNPRDDLDHMAIYRDFWQPLVETDGVLDVDKVARELSDWSFVMDQIPLVYDELTGGRMSKHMYFAADVIAEAHEREQRWTDEAIAEARQEWEAERTQVVAATLLRVVAEGRREYAANAPDNQAAVLDTQAVAFDLAARIVGGDYSPLYGLLPSWRWTPAMTEKMRGDSGSLTAEDVAGLTAEQSASPVLPSGGQP